MFNVLRLDRRVVRKNRGGTGDPRGCQPLAEADIIDRRTIGDHNHGLIFLSMSDFHPVCKTDEILPGQGRAFRIGSKVIAIFNEAGTFHAIDDGCPHMGASLAAGYLENHVVTCPLHAWRFDVRDGSWCDNPRVKINSYPLRITGDQIYVDLDVDDAANASS